MKVTYLFLFSIGATRKIFSFCFICVIASDSKKKGKQKTKMSKTKLNVAFFVSIQRKTSAPKDLSTIDVPLAHFVDIEDMD